VSEPISQSVSMKYYIYSRVSEELNCNYFFAAVCKVDPFPFVVCFFILWDMFSHYVRVMFVTLYYSFDGVYFEFFAHLFIGYKYNQFSRQEISNSLCSYGWQVLLVIMVHMHHLSTQNVYLAASQ
jgi:hypothetical protein